MKHIVKIHTGEEFEGFIPFRDQLRYFFSFKIIPKYKVLWKKVGTKKIYRWDSENSQLTLINDISLEKGGGKKK